MSNLVPPDIIEEIVGTRRHPTEHYGRAISADQHVYILHSQQCRDSTPDLRDCPYSVALDRGIEHPYPWTGWRRVQDKPTMLTISRGYLMPDFADYKDGINKAREVQS